MTETFPVIKLSNWKIFTSDEEVYLSGVADNHPRLGKNATVWHTSAIQEVLYDEKDILKVKTYNSIYVIELKYMSTELSKQSTSGIKDKFPELHKIIVRNNLLSSDKLDRVEKERILNLIKQGKQELKAAEEQRNNELLSNIQDKEDTIYLEISNIDSGDILAYHIGNKTGVIKPSLHIGMFQDSVLYMEHGLVDFRYFPEWDGIRIYSWSENIKHLFIKNLKEYNIRVDKQIIRPGETIEIDNSNYNCGLFSPNCVDGNSLFKTSIENESK